MTRMAHEITNRYRDLLIREIQHLKATRIIVIPTEVESLMHGIEREQTRDRRLARTAFRVRLRRLWRWLLPRRMLHVRRDDEPRPSDLYLLESTVIANLNKHEIGIRILMLRDLLFNLMTWRARALQREYLIDLERPAKFGVSRQDSAKDPAAGAPPDSAMKITGQVLPGSMTSGASGPSFSSGSEREPDIEALRGEAQALLSRLYRRYEGVPAVESLRSEIGSATSRVAILIFLWSLFAIVISPSLFWWACMAGSIGAAISVVQRLYTLEPRDEPMRTWLALQNGRGSLQWTPVIGMAFAIVMAALMRSGLLSGALFPEATDWQNGALDVYPLPSSDAARFLVWTFAAGWAERLVPDVLSKLTPRSQDKLA